MSVTNDQRRLMLEKMLVIRTFEERMQRLFEQNQLPGFLHLSIGQEAVAAGVCKSLRDSDWIVTTHRGHGHVLAKGADLAGMVAELFGKETGSCRGVGGSMHLTDPRVGVLCANAIVGASIGLATGAGFSAKYNRTGAVAVPFFGDGAANQGIFHECLNYAALWNLPVVYVCENNGYAEMSPQSTHTNIKDIAQRAASYDIPGVVVDGNEVEDVFEATSAAVARAREGGGPTLIECKTYRVRGHFEGDQQAYKPAAEVESWLARDPVVTYTDRLLGSGVIEQAFVDGIRSGSEARIDDAIAAARDAAVSLPAVLHELTYANPLVDATGRRSSNG